MKTIVITIGTVSIKVEFNNSHTAQRIYDSLPLQGSVNFWGKEIYLDIPLKLKLEEGARANVEVGELGYWPMGPAFCIFFWSDSE